MKILANYIAKLAATIEKQIETSVYREMKKINGSKYLDCGCWYGEKTIKRAKESGVKKIYGLELEDSAIHIASQKGINIKKGNLNEKMPFKNASFDVITATEVIEHLVNVDMFISEIKRVLKKGGTFIVSTENLASWHNIMALIFGNQPYTGPYISRKFRVGHRPCAKYYKDAGYSKMQPHLNVMTSKALAQLLSQYGFEVKKVYGIGYYPFPKPISSILARFDKYHASYVLIVCQK